MKGKAEKVLGIILALMLLGILTTKVLSQPSDLPEKHSTKQDQLVHTIQPRLAQNYGKLPLSFEANQGQTDPSVKFLSRGGGYTLFLTLDEAVLSLVKPPTRRALMPGRAGASAASLKVGGLPLPSGLLQSPLDLFRPSALLDTKTAPETPGSPPTSAVQLQLAGVNPHAQVVGLDKLPGVSNYFIGNNPKKWRTNIATYAKVKYQNVYPGIDLVYYGSQGHVEYDFVVNPGANPRAIRLSVAAISPSPKGAKSSSPQIAANGDLTVPTDIGAVRFQKPVVYQESSGGARAYLDGRYALAKGGEVAFVIPKYNPRSPLVIDPVLSYSTFLGGNGLDEVQGIVVDSSGDAYVSGMTASTNFPATPGAFQTSLPAISTGYSYFAGGPTNTFVAKINPSGTALLWATYLGGSFEEAYGAQGIAVDSTGDVYVTGQTSSTDFPVTPGAFQTVNGAAGQSTPGGGEGDAFVTKLNPTGSALVYSTFLGGTTSESNGTTIAVDASGNAYVAGNTQATDFPVTSGAFQTSPGGGYYGNCSGTIPSVDAFVAKLNPTGSGLIYASYLGGNGDDQVRSIALDSSGDAYLAGWTGSSNFPTTPGAFQGAEACGAYGFVAEVNSTGSSLIYSTELRGASQPSSVETVATSIALDAAGDAYVTGSTQATDFPVTAGAFQTSLTGSQDAFVAEVNPTGTGLVYASYLGGTGGQSGVGVALDQTGDAFIAGFTDASDFPVTANAIQSSAGGSGDAFVAELNPTGTNLLFSTYLGGSGYDQAAALALDGAGGIYVGGLTESADFPVTSGALQTVHGAQSSPSGAAARDGFVAKITLTSNQPEVTLSTNSLTFGPQNVGSPSAPQTEIVTNTGTANLTISLVAIGGTNASDFTTSNDTCTGATVTPNSTCTFSVMFTPTTTGAESGSITITDNASNSPQTVSLTGVGISGAASVSPASRSFGDQALGTTTAAKTFTLSSTGTTNLNLASITIAGTNASDFAETDNCPASMGPGVKCTLSVTLTPSQTGAETAAVTVADSAANSPQTVALSGTGVVPVALSPVSLSFGKQALNMTSAAKTVNLTNNLDSALAITTITASGDFAQTNNCGTSVPANSKCTISVTFTPSLIGGETGTLTVTDGASTSPQTASLSGTGVVPATLSPISLSFGNQPQSTTSAAKNVTLTNNLDSALAITITTSGDFAQTGDCGSSVPADGKCTISVTFTPSIIGGETGTLTVTDGASNSPQTAALAGTGIVQAKVAPISLTFAKQTVGSTSAAKDVTLTNNLSAALPISITFTGANPGDFAETDTCSGSVAAGSQCTVAVTFTPTAAGTRTATLNVNDSANNSPQTVALTGTGK
jgi:hypothetical protein